MPYWIQYCYICLLISCSVSHSCEPAGVYTTLPDKWLTEMVFKYCRAEGDVLKCLCLWWLWPEGRGKEGDRWCLRGRWDFGKRHDLGGRSQSWFFLLSSSFWRSTSVWKRGVGRQLCMSRKKPEPPLIEQCCRAKQHCNWGCDDGFHDCSVEHEQYSL